MRTSAAAAVGDSYDDAKVVALILCLSISRSRRTSALISARRSSVSVVLFEVSLAAVSLLLLLFEVSSPHEAAAVAARRSSRDEKVAPASMARLVSRGGPKGREGAV